MSATAISFRRRIAGNARHNPLAATAVGIDRACCTGSIKTMVKEGLVSERKQHRAIHVYLTTKGNTFWERLINARVAADETIRHQLTSDERAILLRLLTLIADLEF